MLFARFVARSTFALFVKIGIDAHSLEGLRTGARGRYLLNLVKEWARMDTGDNEFILYFQRNIPDEEFLAAPKFIKKILRGPLGIKSFTLYYNWLLPRAAARDKVEICFFPFYMLPYTHRKKNSAVTLHDVVFEAHREWFGNRHYWPLHLLGRNAAKNARLVLTISEFTKSEIMKYYTIGPERIRVIPLGPDTFFRQEPQQKLVRAVKDKYGIKNKFLFFVGSIFNRRHIPECIKAFSELAKEFPDYQFFISGRNLTRPRIDIDEIIRKANAALSYEAIIRVDYTSDEEVLALYKNADLVLYLSSYEGFGLPVLEGMSTGRPVLTTNLTAIGEIIGDYPGTVQNPEDPKEIYTQIKRILTDSSFKDELIRKGFIISEQYSWKKTAEKTLNAFLECKK